MCVCRGGGSVFHNDIEVCVREGGREGGRGGVAASPVFPGPSRTHPAVFGVEHYVPYGGFTPSVSRSYFTSSVGL